MQWASSAGCCGGSVRERCTSTSEDPHWPASAAAGHRARTRYARARVRSTLTRVPIVAEADADNALFLGQDRLVDLPPIRQVRDHVPAVRGHARSAVSTSGGHHATGPQS